MHLIHYTQVKLSAKQALFGELMQYQTILVLYSSFVRVQHRSFSDV